MAEFNPRIEEWNMEAVAYENNRRAFEYLAGLVMTEFADASLEQHAVALRPVPPVTAWMQEAVKVVGDNVRRYRPDAMAYAADSVTEVFHIGRVASGTHKIWQHAGSGEYSARPAYYDSLIQEGLVEQPDQAAMAIGQLLRAYDKAFQGGSLSDPELSRAIVMVFGSAWPEVRYEGERLTPDKFKQVFIKGLSREARESLKDPQRRLSAVASRIVRTAAKVAPTAGVAAIVGAGTAQAAAASTESVSQVVDPSVAELGSVAGGFIVPLDSGKQMTVRIDPAPSADSGVARLDADRGPTVADIRTDTVVDVLRPQPVVATPEKAVDRQASGETDKGQLRDRARLALIADSKWPGKPEELLAMYKTVVDRYDHPLITVDALLTQGVAESSLDPKAESHYDDGNVAAAGISQFLKETAEEYGLIQNGHDYRYDPEKSIDAQARYLIHIYEKYVKGRGFGSKELAMTFAGYNVGQGNIKKGLTLITDPDWQSYAYVEHIAGWQQKIDDAFERLQRKAGRERIHKGRVSQAEIHTPGHMVDGVRVKKQLEKKYRGVSGRLESGDELEELGEHWPGQKLHPAAAAALRQLDAAFYKHFGYHIQLTDSYRSYRQQEITKDRKGRFAAEPGTSNHGWGLAVDFASNINNEGSRAHEWMEKHAPAYGWINPKWAEDGKGIEEPWHWEFVGSGSANKL